MNPNSRAVLEKLKVEKASSKHKKIKPRQSDKNIICKLTEKKKKTKNVKEIEEESSNTSYTPVEDRFTLSAYNVELLKKSEVEMLHKIRRLKSRLKHFERRFDDAVKSDIITHFTKTCNKTCEAIAVYDTAVQTCDVAADNISKNSEQIEDLKRMIEQLNMKIFELAEMSKINQLVNIRSQTGNNSNEYSHAEFSRSLDHLERRIDRLIDYLEVQNRKAPSYMNSSNFTFGNLGDGDQLENKVHAVDQLFLESTEKIGCSTKKLQSVVIVNDPICPKRNKKSARTKLTSKRSVTSQTTIASEANCHSARSERVKKKISNKKKKSTCCGCFYSKKK